MNNTALRMKLETRNQKPTSARFCVKRSMLALACAGLFAITAGAAPAGVTVNGTALDDAVPSSGTGWSYAPPALTLSGAGPYAFRYQRGGRGASRRLVECDVYGHVLKPDARGVWQ